MVFLRDWCVSPTCRPRTNGPMHAGCEKNLRALAVLAFSTHCRGPVRPFVSKTATRCEKTTLRSRCVHCRCARSQVHADSRSIGVWKLVSGVLVTVLAVCLPCAISWAFSSVEAMSDRLCTYGVHANVSLSAQQMNSCCDECGNGCNGGQITTPWVYWTNTGLVSNECEPCELGFASASAVFFSMVIYVSLPSFHAH